MPQSFIYLLKANIALALFYMVYRFGLRRLTAYTTEEVNRLFKREMFGGVGTLGVDDITRYGIAEKGLRLIRHEEIQAENEALRKYGNNQ